MAKQTAKAMPAPNRDTAAARPGVASGKLAWRVARRLAEQVIAAGWPVGERLGTETKLMSNLGVSREPFREGVRLLELQGIVRMTRGPRGGLLVTAPALDVVSSLIRGYLELSDISFSEVIDARRIIERHAVRLAVGNRLPMRPGCRNCCSGARGHVRPPDPERRVLRRAADAGRDRGRTLPGGIRRGIAQDHHRLRPA